MKKRFSAILVSLTAIVLAVIMASGCSFISTSTKKNYSTSQGDSVTAAQTVNFNTTEKTRNIEDAFIEAVSKVERSAVQVSTDGGAGSGVIVDISFKDTDTEHPAAWKKDDNIIYIVTCHHMISKSGTFGRESIGNIEIRIPDENYSYNNTNYIFSGYIGNLTNKTAQETSQEYAVTLVGGDFESDIALLKLDLNIAAKSGNKLSADKIVKAQIPDSTYITRLGETVFSIGNPTGTLPGSVARGIVSYLARPAAVDDIGEMTLMQIDVSTNPGNSGGGLYNLYGELIGITNAGNTNYTNINFAIPCHLENGNGFVDIVGQLGGTATNANYGYVSGRKVKFGFSVTEVNENGEQYLKVSSVTSGSIAKNTGLKEGDVIETVKVNGGAAQKVTTIDKFGEIMSGLTAGDIITFEVPRLVYSWGRPTTQITEINMRAESFWFCNTGE